MNTVRIELDGDFAGQHIELQKRVSARVLIELQGEPAQQFAAFERLVVSHSLNGIDGKPCESVLDAPVDALAQAMEKWAKAIGTLPQA